MAAGDYIPADGDTQTDQGTWLRHLSVGSKHYPHEPTDFDNMPVTHRVTTQMVKVAPGFKWCSTCGDVRPQSYFDVTKWEERGKITATDEKTGKPIAWDGIRFAVEWHHECKQCMNMRDPKLRPTCFCSGCKQDKKRDQFGDDERNVTGKKSICLDCDAKGAHQRRAQKAEDEGRALRPYAYRTA